MTSSFIGVVAVSATLVARRGSATTRPPLVLDVTAEGPRRRELAELVTDHCLGDEHRHVLAAVVYGNGVAEHRRHDHRATRPGLDHVLGALVVLGVHLLGEVVVHERTLFQTPWHLRLLLAPLVLVAATHDQAVALLVCAAGTALRHAPRADRVATTGGLALTTAVRVVDRVPGDTTDGRALALPAHAAGLAPVDVRLLSVADLADGRAAARVDV